MQEIERPQINLYEQIKKNYNDALAILYELKKQNSKEASSEQNENKSR